MVVNYMLQLRNVLLCLLILAGSAFPQDYVWPTEASKNITSSFCEFRPRHYHAAIDIKTWNQTGYKIYAIDDGYVYRLRVSANGYGKAIYLKLKDGNYVIYGHLDGFTPELAAYADSVRLASKKNYMDRRGLARTKFPVKKGQHIGYTGKTGIGVPHLHFEIRDSYNRPINPLRYYKDDVVDTITPKPRYLAVVPSSAGTLINNKPDTLIMPVAQNVRVVLKDPISLSGQAYLALRVFDQADGVHNRFDFYRAEMFINDSLAYYVQYDRFSHDETRLIELDKNFSFWRKGLRYYHNFYRHSANSLPFYGNFASGAGMLNGKSLKEGANTVLFKIYDYFGNFCQLQVPIEYQKKSDIRIQNASNVNRSPKPPTLTFYGGEAAVAERGLAFDPAWRGHKDVSVQGFSSGGVLLSFPTTAEKLETPFGAQYDSLLAAELANWHQVIPGKERNLRSVDQVFKLYFPSNAIYDTLHVRIDKYAPVAALSESYQYMSDIYEASPFDQPLNHGAYITVSLPDSIKGKKGVGIYYARRKRGWAYLPTQYEKTSNSYSTRVTSLEKFVAIQDTIPPEIIALNLTKFNRSTTRHPALRFAVTDNFSGIYRERQIQLHIDGKWSLFEFDPEEDIVTIPERYIPVGDHTVKLTVRDNAGNSAVKEFKINR